MNRVVLVGVMLGSAIAAARPVQTDPEQEARPVPPLGQPGDRVVVPVVRFGAPTITGTRDAGVITRAVKARASALRGCYDRARGRTPELAGTVRATFEITPAGKLAALVATGGSVALQGCVRQALAGLTFPVAPGAGAVRVAYPIVFARTEVTPRQVAPILGAGGAGLSATPGGSGFGAVGGGTAVGGGAAGYAVRRPPGPGAPRSQLRILALDVDGTLDRAVVRRYVRRELGAVRACYEMAHRRSPNLAGRVAVTFTVREDGRVAAVKVAALDAKQKVAGLRLVAPCLRARFARLRFPRLGDGTTRVHLGLDMQWIAVAALQGYSFGNANGGWGSLGTGSSGLRGASAGARLGAGTVEGTLARAIVFRYLRRNLPAMRTCYDQARHGASRAGGVSLAFTIRPDGGVAGARATGDAGAAACLQQLVTKIQFPRPRSGEVRVVVPVAFPVVAPPPAPAP